MHNKISKLCFVIIYISVFFGINTKKVYSQLVIEKTVTSDAILQDIVKNVLVGSGVEVSNITATGWFDNDGTGQLGSFSTGSSSTNLGIAKGILLSTGKIQDAKGPNNSTNKMFQWYNATGDKNSDSDLEMITGSTGSSRDAAILEFDFKPAATPLRFKYVFASEEYPEYVCSFYNDIFAFFLTGPKPGGGSYNKQNIAIIPGTSLPVAINSVNSGNPGIDPISGVPYDKNDCISTNYNNYYINNNGGATIQYDGFTKVLIATAEVIPCQTYHIKLAIADFYDDKYDSGVFLEANSFSSDATSVNVAYTIPSLGTSLYEGCNKTIITFSTSQSSSVDKSINFTLTGTATRGTDYSLNTNNDFVTIKAGETQTQLEITGKADGMDEGDETIIIKVETSACAFETYTITLKDYKEMTITPGSDKTICEGQSADINSSATGGVAPYQYKWSNSAGTTATVKVSPVETTTYTVTINDVCQATATTSVKVNVNPLPKNVFNKAKDQICFGDSVKITSIPSNGKAPYSFLWNNNSTSDNINIINKSTDEIIKKITYKIKITDNNNCFIDDSLSLSLIPQFKVLNTTDSVCLGECTGKITLNVKGGNGTYTYLWNNNKTTKDIDSLCAKDYFVTITDGVGCTYKSEKIAINALTLDTSYTITKDPSNLLSPLSVDFSYTGTDKITWDFGDGSPKSNEINPNHIYNYKSENDKSNNGSNYYTATLTVEKANCTYTLKIIIEVKMLSNIKEVPDVISRSSAVNNNFSIVASGIKTLDVQIFNRWGLQIFDKIYNESTIKTEDYNINGTPSTFKKYFIWDGTNNKGSKAAAGTYFFIIKATKMDNSTEDKKGTITLLD